MRKARYILWIVVIAGLALTACGKQAPTPTPGSTRPQPGAPGGLGELNSLVLGTLKLEETADAVTPEQAAALLLLWQMIQSGTLQGAAETQAVIRQIEGVMTDSQIAAIEAMGLTFEDVQAWMQEQGIEMPAPPAGGGGFGAFQNPWATPPGRSLSEEERSRLRQEFQNMSPEQRATRMAEMGIQRPEGTEGGGGGVRPGGFGGQFNALFTALTELLAERAGQ